MGVIPFGRIEHRIVVLPIGYDGLALEERQQENEQRYAAEGDGAREKPLVDSGREKARSAHIGTACDAQLMQVVHALHAPPCFPGRLNGR